MSTTEVQFVQVNSNAVILLILNRLYVVRGKPSEVFPKLFKEWDISRLTFEVDTEPYAIKRDSHVEDLAKSHGVEVIKIVSHTLYDTAR